MGRFKLYFLIFSICLYFSCAKLSDKRLCVDVDCSRPVSIAKTLLRYSSPEANVLSFLPNEKVTIYSKSAGSNEELWGVEIGGKRGYIPKKLVKEIQIITKPTLLVNTEFIESNVPNVPSNEEIIGPSKVKQNYEVIDGTTIYLPPVDASTENNDGEKAFNTENMLDASQNSITEHVNNQGETENLKKDEVSEESFGGENSLKSSEDKEKDISGEEDLNHKFEKNKESSKSSEDGYLTGILDNMFGMINNDESEEEKEDLSNENHEKEEANSKSSEHLSQQVVPTENAVDEPLGLLKNLESDTAAEKVSSENVSENLEKLGTNDKQEDSTETLTKPEIDDSENDQVQNNKYLETKDEGKVEQENFVKNLPNTSEENTLNSDNIISNGLNALDVGSDVDSSTNISDKSKEAFENKEENKENAEQYIQNVGQETANLNMNFDDSKEMKYSKIEKDSDSVKQVTTSENEEGVVRVIENTVKNEESNDYLKNIPNTVEDNNKDTIFSSEEKDNISDVDSNINSSTNIADESKQNTIGNNEENSEELKDSNIQKNSEIIENTVKNEITNETSLNEQDQKLESAHNIEVQQEKSIENKRTSSTEQVVEENQKELAEKETISNDYIQEKLLSEPLPNYAEPSDPHLSEEKKLSESSEINLLDNSSNQSNEAITSQQGSGFASPPPIIPFPSSIIDVRPDENEEQKLGYKPVDELHKSQNYAQNDNTLTEQTYTNFAKEPETLSEIYNTIPGYQKVERNSNERVSNERIFDNDYEEENKTEEQLDGNDSYYSNKENQEAAINNDSSDNANLHSENESQDTKQEDSENNVFKESPGIFSYFGSRSVEDGKQDVPLISENLDSEKKEKKENLESQNVNSELQEDNKISEDAFCIKEECPNYTNTRKSFEDVFMAFEIPNLSSDFFLYLITTAISVIVFLLGYVTLDKSRRESPLIAKINKLEKEFLIVIKEKEMLVEQIENGLQENQHVESQDYLNLKEEYQDTVQKKCALEEQVQMLEKELENSTEVGLELNRMLSDILSSENAGETLMSNIEGLQAQIVEQQDIVSNMTGILSLKETENHELNLELDISNKKVVELQNELDKLLLNIIKIEEEKEALEKSSEIKIIELKKNVVELNKKLEHTQEQNIFKIEELKEELSTAQRNCQLKIKEYDGLKQSMHQMKNMKNANTVEALLEVTSIKAELEQLKMECKSHHENLRKEKESKMLLETKSKTLQSELETVTSQFDQLDKAKLELETKLQVLTNYFKDKEAQLQKELTKYESMWSMKQGEATSTSERIKYLQSEVQNYKAQNESLKQEIVSQEVELKSQISVLEKKVHENWVSARQAERRLEDLKHEASQLRNRLTLRERALQEDKVHNRLPSPLEQNGDLPISPLHLESPSSPPLLYNSRDHITKSPALLGMPPPFLPPPPGAPFMPPPPLPFMPPPPPDMFPGDHRPPPLGRMSSPPLNTRYSPDRRPYSPYDRRSPSPSYEESEYSTSPVHHRRYSPFSRRLDHRRMPPPMGKINGRSGELSSGSGNSNESLNEINHSKSKV